MALPPRKITDQLMVRIAGLVDSNRIDAGVKLEVSVGLSRGQDDWETIVFIVRTNDELTINREKYIVESLSFSEHEVTEDRTPGTHVGVNVVLTSASNRISLSS
jgi:hypothetical protein